MHNSLSIYRWYAEIPVVACWTSAGQLDWRSLVLFWLASHRLADRRERNERIAAAGYSQRGKDALGKLCNLYDVQIYSKYQRSNEIRTNGAVLWARQWTFREDTANNRTFLTRAANTNSTWTPQLLRLVNYCKTVLILSKLLIWNNFTFGSAHC